MHNCKACKARITLGIYCEVCERQVGLLAERDRLAAENAELRAGAIAANWHWCTDGNAIINYYGTTIALVSSKEQAERIVRQHQLACNYYRLRIRELDPSADGLHDWQLEKFNQFVVSAAKFEEIKSENAELKAQATNWQQTAAEHYQITVLKIAENKQLRDLLALEQIPHADANEQLAAANATLDRLRQAVPEVLPPHMSWKDSLDGTRAILYPPDMTNEDR